VLGLRGGLLLGLRGAGLRSGGRGLRSLATKVHINTEKKIGNDFYKKKQLDEAIEHYTKAWEIFKDITYPSSSGSGSGVGSFLGCEVLGLGAGVGGSAPSPPTRSWPTIPRPPPYWEMLSSWLSCRRSNRTLTVSGSGSGVGSFLGCEVLGLGAGVGGSAPSPPKFISIPRSTLMTCRKRGSRISSPTLLGSRY
jgi:hypothetical protein